MTCSHCEEQARKLAAKKLKSWLDDPTSIQKRIRIPYKLYLELRGNFENMSAYIRSLIYKDLGMTEEYEREVKLMGRIDK
jgi:hypothetical protein